MQLNTYLFFNGQCEAAFKFYEKVFNGRIEAMMPHTGTPAEEGVPAEWKEKILHAKIAIGDTLLMGSDSPPQYAEEMKGFSINIPVDTPEEAERIFNALAENGTVKMALEQTFWARKFGMLTDQFGVHWMINCE